jgi:hypothetical protein
MSTKGTGGIGRSQAIRRPATPAWEAGLRRGMLVSAVGRTSVRTPRQFLAVVSGKSGPVQVHLADEQTPLRTVPPGS